MEAIGDGTVEGKVVAGGIAQSVTREGDVTRIRLERIPGATPKPPDGLIPLPEPVTIEGGGFVIAEIDPDLLPGVPPAPIHIRSGMTVTTVYTGQTAGAWCSLVPELEKRASD